MVPQWSGEMRKLVYGLTLCCLILISCAVSWLQGDERPLSIDEYQELYSHVGGPWVGRQVGELTAVRGQPDDIREAKPSSCAFPHGIRVQSYIYYNDSEDGSCIDTFVVVEASGKIIKYYCR